MFKKPIDPNVGFGGWTVTNDAKGYCKRITKPAVIPQY